ncbi:hypothetical protein NP493_80g01000 [Ridgeia piscesae]|uniref:Uncharacterized protein n=1 Tax=Ridgeia piscesae TaxID=27915 RepID=A0AAD9P9H5_RIDPI|nr:hypothetical protein NP493_80g01000 [Ridgeia piscesae]
MALRCDENDDWTSLPTNFTRFCVILANVLRRFHCFSCHVMCSRVFAIAGSRVSRGNSVSPLFLFHFELTNIYVHTQIKLAPCCLLFSFGRSPQKHKIVIINVVHIVGRPNIGWTS